MCGDLLNGRTVHSLCKALSQFKDNKFIFISTPQLGMPPYIKDIIKASGSTFEEVNTIEEGIGKLDVLYMTRIQQERFASKEEYLAQKNTYVLDKKKMQRAKQNMIVMHPLPRVDEIEVEVDYDPRAKYFVQTIYGMYARMALMKIMLDKPDRTPMPRKFDTHKVHCDNPRCITAAEPYLPNLFKELGGDMLTCTYCDGRKLI